jgi:hypothetical protein
MLEMSWYGDATRGSVPLGEAFHSRRLMIKSSQVGAVADARARALVVPATDGAGSRTAGRSRLRRVAEQATSAFDTLPDTLARLAQAP